MRRMLQKLIKLSNRTLIDFKEILGKVDVVSIATPTFTHFGVAFFCNQQIHVLLEKAIFRKYSQKIY